MTNKFDMYYKLLKQTPISNARYELNAPNDHLEIQAILFDLGFRWQDGKTDFIHIPKIKKYLYTILYDENSSSHGKKYNGLITFSTDPVDRRLGRDVNQITLTELGNIHLKLQEAKRKSENQSAVPTTKFDEVW